MANLTKWYQIPEKNSDIVISSRIRLARNLAEIPFNAKMTPQQRCELNEKVKSALSCASFGENNLNFINMDELNEINRLSLVEKHTVSREFIENSEHRMLVLSQDESIAIMVNEEDHLRIQVMQNGLNLAGAFEVAAKLDDLLDEKLSLAFDEKLGYLTSCPTNLGTGLRASVMMHLPALEQSGLMSRLSGTISKLGLTIRGTYGEGSTVIGSVYQISNQITLGITERDSIQNLESVVLQLIDSENSARSNLAKNEMQFNDMIFRSLGILKFARMLSSKEFFELCSDVRLGISMKLITDITPEILNELICLVGTASICELENKQLSPLQRDIKRAEIVREKLK